MFVLYGFAFLATSRVSTAISSSLAVFVEIIFIINYSSISPTIGAVSGYLHRLLDVLSEGLTISGIVYLEIAILFASAVFFVIAALAVFSRFIL